jgi:hypothetical protein
MRRGWGLAVVLSGVLANGSSLRASGHGPVFGMATPTNGAGGWAIDFGAMGRIGEPDNASAIRTMLTYGINEDLQISTSVPFVLGSAPLPAARMTGMMPGGGDFESILAWRFHRQGTNIGTRVESTAYGGLIVPGPQKPAGLVGTFPRTQGMYAGVATGLASRSNYVWGGIGYTRFAEKNGDRRPTVFSYSAVWGYRPPAMRHEYPRWDWRLFAELTGERSTKAVHLNDQMPGTNAHQLFVGPSTLGIYKNYAIQAGIQFPVYRDTGARLERERFRYAANASYFF